MIEAEEEGYWLDGPPPDPAEIVMLASDIDPYPLDMQSCVIELEEEGGAITAYRLRRPQSGDGAGPDEYLAYAQIFDRQGQAAADVWLWDQIALEIQPPDAFSWLPLTAEMKQRVPTAHKLQAIYARYLCRVTVLVDQSEMTFAACRSCVQLEIGPPNAPAGVLELMVDEWSREQRAKYRRAGAGLAARLSIATSIFDDLFHSCAGGTVNDLHFTTERRAEFLRWIEAPFKLTMLDTLAAQWDAPLKVSVRFAQ